MDTSKQYIKMCNCPEIQGMWNPKQCDFYWYWMDCDPKTGIGAITFIDYDEDPDEFKDCTEIWLPRQDQLQRMLQNGTYCDQPKGKYCHSCFSAFYFSQTLAYFRVANRQVTAEQLWLAFVMHELHGNLHSPTSTESRSGSVTQKKKQWNY